ncbi:ATP-binding protein [Streptomyces sp. NPDC047108]|uniref:ATP-binding protein n=1 Tax=Streptomyces sp. NPDC047108 TaxID=3155025 RepID=UPI0033DE0014
MPHPSTRARPTGCPGYSETLPCEPESAATARRLVRAALLAWGLDGYVEDAVVVVSELVGNAVRHSGSRSLRVTVTRPGAARVRIGVVDKSTMPPRPGMPEDEDESGRGLVLVEDLAAVWGSDPLPWGKRVWAELRGEGRG